MGVINYDYMERCKSITGGSYCVEGAFLIIEPLYCWSKNG